MPPKFTTIETWQQAEQVMQPALIRLVDNLRKQLDQSSWQGTYREISDPIPGHQLCLRQGDREHIVDLWELCYELCFQDYQPHQSHPQPVQVDPALLDNTGEVDWHYLDNKAHRIVAQVFSTLPT